MQNMTKNELRATYRSMRLALSPAETKLLDTHILAGLQSIDFSTLSHIHIYLPIAKWNEYDTMPFIRWLRHHYPAIFIVVSVSQFDRGTLQHFVWNLESVVENAWGIPELVVQPDTVAVAPEDIDLVVMPLLVCDRKGNRIGYGKGFYDRFLHVCRPAVQKVGISYFAPLLEQIPVDPWDVPLDSLVTPAGTISF